jgi:regulatory protein
MIQKRDNLEPCDLLKKAKDYVYRLLKFRMRSEQEIIQRLKNKKFDDNTIKKVVSYFKDIGLIDDLKFCQLWFEQRLNKPFGFLRITEELRQKGIPQQIIDKVLAEKKNDYNEEELILKIIQKKLKDKISCPSIKDKRKLYSYLLQRGFTWEAVSGVIDSL